MVSKLMILLLIGTVSSASLSTFLLERHKPEFDDDEVKLNVARRIPWDQTIVFRAVDFPCPKEGFYSHPSNCSRFYRCVNYNDKSPEFSIYLFECPSGNKFVPVFDVCIPGSCKDSQDGMINDEPFIPAVGGSSGSNAAEGNQGSNVEGGAGGSMGDGGEGSNADGDAGNNAVGGEPANIAEAVSEGAAGGDPGNDVGGDPGSEPSEGNQGVGIGDPSNDRCEGRIYEAHAMYCNRYHLCGDPSTVYQCGYGTVFSEPNQMCRLKQFNPELCTNKEVHPEAAFKIAAPFGFLRGVSPMKNSIQIPFGNAYIDQTLKDFPGAVDPLLSSLDLLNTGTQSRPGQIQQDGLGSSQQEINKPAVDPFDALLMQNYAPPPALVHATLPKLRPFHSRYQPSHYHVTPLAAYSHHRPELFPSGVFVNPYNNFYNSFHQKHHAPLRRQYAYMSDESDDDDDSVEDYGYFGFSS